MLNKFRIIFFFIALFSISLLATDIIQDKFIHPLNEELEAPLYTANEMDFMYRVSVFNGKIAVFEKDSKLPYKVYNTYIDTLPSKDQEILKNGIRVNTASEVMKIIEEYTS